MKSSVSLFLYRPVKKLHSAPLTAQLKCIWNITAQLNILTFLNREKVVISKWDSRNIDT